MSGIRAVIFDLDGTLADTLHDIMAAMNHVLSARGLPTHDERAYRQFIGEGARRLAEKASGGMGASVDELVAAFRERYFAHLIEHSAPYPGVLELLRELHARGLALAVLSNKPHDATRRVVHELFDDVPLHPVLGQRDGVARKPDPAAALEIARTLQLEPAQCAFVGDTRVDMQTARAAGMRAIGVHWGFRAAPELHEAGAFAVIGRPPELLSLLD